MFDLDKEIEYINNLNDSYDINDLFEEYLKTKNPIIKEKIIYKYIPYVKDTMKDIDYSGIEFEDLTQAAYETLVNCINTYNKELNIPFISYLNKSLDELTIKVNNRKNNKTISLSEIDVYSNNDYEEKVLNNVTKEQIIKDINKILDIYSGVKYIDYFKNEYGLKYDKDLVIDSQISKNIINSIKNKILFILYLELNKKYPYYPSENLEKIINDSFILWIYNISAKDKYNARNINYDKYEYLEFDNKDYDNIEYSHAILERKNL